MEVFRLSKKKYSSQLNGKGAALKGGRWNSTGVELIYTSANRSLAMAEVAVHLTIATLPEDYIMATIFIPDNITFKEIEVKELPNNWNSFPYIPTTQAFGNNFVTENKHCLLKIPSAVTKGDCNILINPNHPEFSKIKIIAQEPFPFDSRIYR